MQAVKEIVATALVGLAWSIRLAAQSITTVAGGGTEEGRPARAIQLRPQSVVAAKSGDVTFVDFRATSYRLRTITGSSNLLFTVAGTGADEYAGDGGPATKASFLSVSELVQDGRGDLYVVDSFNFDFAVVRRIAASTGLITRVVGAIASAPPPADGLPATAASFAFIDGACVDAAGNIYFVAAAKLWRAGATDNLLTFLGGNGSFDPSGDGGPATAAGLGNVSALAVTAGGDLLLATSNRIRKISRTTGIIVTIAGDGSSTISGDGGPATAAGLDFVSSIAVGPDGEVYLTNGNFIRRITPSGRIDTVAGNGSRLFDGDGKPALQSGMEPGSLSIADGSRRLVFSDGRNERIRAIDLTSGLVTTIGGNGTSGYAEENIPATQASLGEPLGVAVDAAGNLYVADQRGHRIRRVDPAGRISTFAGNGSDLSDGNDGQATSVAIREPAALAFDSAGRLYFSEFAYVRRLDPATGLVTRIAGDGRRAYLGEGVPATRASLPSPFSIAVDAAGNLYVADTSAHRIRRVSAADGIIRVFAGTGDPDFGGDGGPATMARLDTPYGIAIDGSGNLLIADTFNHRIRRVDAGSGIIVTVAGNGQDVFSGDGGPATAAGIGTPNYLTVTAAGNILFTDSFRLREISAATGLIRTVAGDGGDTFGGDDGPATGASFGSSAHVAVAANGDLVVTDSEAGRVRAIRSCRTVAAAALQIPSNNALEVPQAPRLSWRPVDGAFRYDVYLDTVTPPARIAGADVVTPSFAPANLQPATTYYWKVDAKGDPFCPAVSRASSEIRQFTTGSVCAPSGVSNGGP